MHGIFHTFGGWLVLVRIHSNLLHSQRVRLHLGQDGAKVLPLTLEQTPLQSPSDEGEIALYGVLSYYFLMLIRGRSHSHKAPHTRCLKPGGHSCDGAAGMSRLRSRPAHLSFSQSLASETPWAPGTESPVGLFIGSPVPSGDHYTSSKCSHANPAHYFGLCLAKWQEYLDP